LVRDDGEVLCVRVEHGVSGRAVLEELDLPCCWGAAFSKSCLGYVEQGSESQEI